MDDKIKVIVGDDDKIIDCRFFDTLNEALNFADECIYSVGITRNNGSEFYDQCLHCWKSEPEIEDEYLMYMS